MIETLFGTLLGGVFRLAPELMKLIDKKNERAHELSMLDKQAEFEKNRAASAANQAQVEGNIAISIEEIKALVEGSKVQGQLTGVKFVDAVNSLQRPLITFWWVIVLQTGVMVATFASAYGSDGDLLAAILSAWGPPEKGIVASIISFWFLDRAIRMQGK